MATEVYVDRFLLYFMSLIIPSNLQQKAQWGFSSITVNTFRSFEHTCKAT